MDQIFNRPVAHYKPLVDTSEDAPEVTRKSWRGRKVSAEDRLLDAAQGPAATTADKLKARLQARYGRTIQQKVVGDLPSDTPLAERRVAALEGKARKLLTEYQSTNRKHLKSWIKDETSAGLVAEQFQLITGYRWDSIPAHERRYMVDQVRLVLSQSQEKLTKNHAKYLAGEYLQQHSSMFTQFCPQTSRMIGELTDIDPPIMGGHLQEWAHVEQNSDDGGLSANDLQIIRNFQYLNNLVMGIVSTSSLEDTKEVSYHEQIEAIKKISLNLMQCINDVDDYAEQLPPELCDAMAADLNRNLGLLHNHKQQLLVNAESDPRRSEQWQKLRLTELGAAREVLKEEIGMYRELDKMSGLSKKERKNAEKIQQSFEELKAKIAAVASGTDKTKFTREETRRYSKHVEHFLIRAGVDSTEAVERMKYFREHQLTHRKWEPIVKPFLVRLNGDSRVCVSHITPAASLKIDLTEHPEGDHDVFPIQYHGSGRPSIAKKEASHAVNLNETQLLVEGKEAFRGLRSATICAYGIKNENERWAASVARAREVVTAAVRMQVDRNETNRQAAADGELIPVKLFSTSLLSPDRFRHFTHIHDDELAMQQEQVAALNFVVDQIQREGSVVLTESNGEPCEINVDMDLITCNFGVNNVSLNPIQRRLMGSWSASEKENLEGLQAFMGSTEPGEAIDGWVGEYLDDEALSEDEQLVVIELVEQIRQIYTSGSYKKEGQDAYEIVERLQNLAYKINSVPHINCKSGKDRTGEADAAIKRLATQIAVNGYVPDPDLPMSREEQILVQQFIHSTGNVELQQQNLNKPGYKTGTGKAVLGDHVYNMTHKPDFDGSVDLHESDYKEG